MASAFLMPSLLPAKVRADELPVLSKEAKSNARSSTPNPQDEEEEEWEADLGAALADLLAQFGIRVPMPTIHMVFTNVNGRQRGMGGNVSELEADSMWDLGDTRTTSMSSPETPVGMLPIAVSFGRDHNQVCTQANQAAMTMDTATTVDVLANVKTEKPAPLLIKNFENLLKAHNIVSADQYALPYSLCKH